VNNNNGTWSFTPAANYNGAVNLSYNVTDGKGGSAEATQSFTLAAVNDAPTVANPIVDQTTKTNTPFSFQLATNTFNDVDAGDTLTYSATRSDGNALPTWLKFDPTTGSFNGTPTTSEAGTLSIKVTATDTSGISANDTFDLAIANINTIGGFTFDAKNAVKESSVLSGQLGTTVSLTPIPLLSDSGQQLADKTVGNSLFSQANSAVSLGSNSTSGAIVLDWGGLGLINREGNDFVIYEYGNAEVPEAFGVGVVSATTGQISSSRYEFYDSFDDSSVGAPDDKQGMFVTAFDLSDFGIAQGEAIDTLVIHNLRPTHRVSGADGQGVLGGTGYTPLTQAGGQAFTSTQFNPDITLVAGLSDVGSPTTSNTLEGTAINDTLTGTAANDLMLGRAGDDTLQAGTGNDILRGEDGNDQLYGGDNDDQLRGDNGHDLLWGDNGNDLVIGNGGNDTLTGGSGNDTLRGDNDNDLLNGGDGMDTLLGGNGNDTLVGGADNDLLNGGAGSDRFVLAASQGRDTIGDFQDGTDFIGLTGGLTFGQLSIAGVGSDTLISLTSDASVLASLTNVNPALITSNDFVTLS
jgi:Ca2+-binding RTX toxin-like protein